MKKVWYYVLVMMVFGFITPMIVGLIDVLSWFWAGVILSGVDWNSLRILTAFMFMVLSAACLVMLDEHYWSKRK